MTSALLNFGGNVVTIGRRADGEPWSVGIQTPGGKALQDYWAAIECADGTVVTSGIYERGFALRGIRYHHILDPRTGWPVQNGLLSVTVLTKSSLLADALTTALFVLGPEKGMDLAQRYGVSAVYLERSGKVIYTEGMPIQFL